MINFRYLWNKVFPSGLATDSSRPVTEYRRWAITTPARIWTFLFCLIAAALIAGRPLGMDKDYQNYLEYYNSILDGEFVNVEVGYKIFSWLSYEVGAGFYGVLFAFSLTAIYGKCVFMRRLPGARRREWLYFGLLYFLIFFPLWELTQIRNAAAVSICCLALLETKKTKAILYFIFAIFLHNVSFIIVCLWCVYRFFYRFKYQIVVFIVIVVYGLLEYMPYYESYASDVYIEKFNPFSLKVFFILISIVYVQVSKGQYAKIFSYYAFGLLFFYFAMGKMPAAAIRVADVSLFFTVLAVSVSRSYIGFFYKSATLLVLGYMFTFISYFGEAKLIDLSVLSF